MYGGKMNEGEGGRVNRHVSENDVASDGNERVEANAHEDVQQLKEKVVSYHVLALVVDHRNHDGAMRVAI